MKAIFNFGSKSTGKIKKKKKAKNENIISKICQMHGRPLLLDAELDFKLCSMIVSLCTAGARINIYQALKPFF